MATYICSSCKDGQGDQTPPDPPLFDWEISPQLLIPHHACTSSNCNEAEAKPIFTHSLRQEANTAENSWRGRGVRKLEIGSTQMIQPGDNISTRQAQKLFDDSEWGWVTTRNHKVRTVVSSTSSEFTAENSLVCENLPNLGSSEALPAKNKAYFNCEFASRRTISAEYAVALAEDYAAYIWKLTKAEVEEKDNTKARWIRENDVTSTN